MLSSNEALKELTRLFYIDPLGAEQDYNRF